MIAGGQLGNIFTAFHAGLCARAFVWGVLVDIIGKASTSASPTQKEFSCNSLIGLRWVLITCIFGLCMGIRIHIMLF